MTPQQILKQQFMQIVETQLGDAQLPEVAQAYERLQKEGYSAEDARALIAQCVACEMYDVVKSNQPFNRARYVGMLNRLPESPFDEDE